MTHRLPIRWKHPAFQSTLTLGLIALALYLGAIYTFAFSQAALGPRKAVLLAIVILNGVILTGLFRQGRDIYTGMFRAGGHRGLYVLLCGLATAALIGMILLHADFVRTRFLGGEVGVFGSLEMIKTRLLRVQVAFIFLSAWLLWMHAKKTVFPPLRFNTTDGLLFLLPLIPLVNYLAQNRGDFVVLTAAAYLAFFLLWPIVLFAALHVLQQWLQAEAIAAPVVAGLAFVYYSTPWISALCKHPVEMLLPVQIALALAVPIALTVACRRAKNTTVKGVVIAVLCSVVSSFVQAIYVGDPVNRPASAAPPTQGDTSDGSDLTALLASPVKRHPDVYLLIYDAYASPAMLNYYGLENASALAYLKSRGFQIYDDAHSLFLASRPSMTSVLDMRITPRATIGQATRANAFFQHHGYKTYQVLNSYLLQGTGRFTADSVFPAWRYASALSTLYRGIGGGEFKAEIVFADSPREEWLAAKRAVFTEGTQPKMLYAHSGYPGHSQNSGNCLPNEIALYADRMRVANDEMKQDIETILRTRRDAIIIVAGDHGPYLTGDCLYLARQKPEDLSAIQLADRYGILLAIRWPDPDVNEFKQMKVLQNVFFAVAAYMRGDEQIWAHRLQNITHGYGGIPDGAVNDGIVTTGKDKGRRLFER